MNKSKDRDRLFDIKRTIQFISDRWLSEQLSVLRVTIHSWKSGKSYPNFDHEMNLYVLMQKYKYQIHYLT